MRGDNRLCGGLLSGLETISTSNKRIYPDLLSEESHLELGMLGTDLHPGRKPLGNRMHPQVWGHLEASS